MSDFRTKKDLCLKVTSGIIFLQILSSCAWMSNRAVLFDDANKSGANATAKSAEGAGATVSKEQYDQLLSKYETLLDKVKTAETSMNDKIENSPSAKEGKMMEELSKITPPADLAETVDVFGKEGITSNIPADVLEQSPKSRMSDSDIEAQLINLQKANTLVSENKLDQALVLLKDLEESQNLQIKVRAKFYLGEMLFRQNEYDLAMQIYEEIIKKYAFSGLVIKSLGRLIVCADKLKMDKKRERYYSILHDFFEEA